MGLDYLFGLLTLNPVNDFINFGIFSSINICRFMCSVVILMTLMAFLHGKLENHQSIVVRGTVKSWNIKANKPNGFAVLLTVELEEKNKNSKL